MPKKKLTNEEKEIIDELTEAHRKHLYEIFTKDTFKLSFDEREKLISGKMDKEVCKILEKHIEEDPQGICKKKKKIPDETCLCPCGREAILKTDKKGTPKIFEREIKTASGTIKVEEYGYYCSKCRKIFFPSQKST